MNTIRKLLLIAVLSCPFVPAFSAIGDTIFSGGVHYVVTVDDYNTADYEVAIDRMEIQPYISVPATVQSNGREYKITSHTNNQMFPDCPKNNPSFITKIDFAEAEYLTTLPFSSFGALMIDTLVLPPNIISFLAPVSHGGSTIITKDRIRPHGITRLFASGNSLRHITCSKARSLVEVDISSSSVDTLRCVGVIDGMLRGGAFEDCPWLERIRLNKTIRSIESHAFSGCNRLTDINMPDSITHMRWQVFNACCLLDSIVIPKNVCMIDSTFALSTYSLKRFVVDSGNCYFKADSGVLYSKSGRTLYSILHSLPQDTFFFPEDVDSVQSIVCGDYCYSVDADTTLRDSVTQLRHVVFNRGLKYLSRFSFRDVPFYTLKNFEYTKIRVLPPGCFDQAYIRSIELPGELTAIGECAFNACRWLEHIRFRGSAVSRMDRAVFTHCVLLDTLDLSAQTRLRIISDSLCESCISLRYVSLPSGIDSIGRKAFYNCTSLDRIEVPLLEPIQIHDDVFYGVDKSSCTLVVPAQAIGKYRSAPVWQEFMNVESGNLVALSVLSSDTTMGTASGSGVFRVGDRNFVYAVARPGYMFTGWSDDASILSASRYVDLSVDSVITANFAIDPDFVYNVSVRSVDPSMGYVSSSLPYAHYGDELTVSATAYSGYRFVGWSDGADENPYSLTVVCDTVLTACFEAVEAVEYMVGAKSEDESKGFVSGGGMYREGEVAELVATAHDGYAFVEWRDWAGNVFSDDVLSVVVLSDSVFTAYFGEDESEIPDSVETVCAGMTVTVSRDGVVSVGGNAGGRMTLHTAAGGLVYSGEVKEVMLPSAGSYILTVKDISFKIVWP